MRKIAVVAALATFFLSATVVTAADLVGSPGGAAQPTSPASATATAAPTATPAPTALPGAAATPGTPATKPVASTQWTATVAPVQVTGSVTVDEAKNGDGTVTFKLNDLLDESTWTVRLERGTLDGTPSPTVIAARSGDEVQQVQNDTLRILLTRAEMARFLSARTSSGVVALISDGSRLSVATFPAG